MPTDVEQIDMHGDPAHPDGHGVVQEVLQVDRQRYLVRWEGASLEDNTWIPAAELDSLPNGQAARAAFHARPTWARG